MTSHTLSKLIELAAKRFRIEPRTLQPEDDIFIKLEMNSFQALSLLSDLELAFDIEIPDYELQGVKTFQGLADVIDKRR